MIEEILNGIYQIRIPLPGNPLKFLNSYLIKGEPKNLLIDTGFNWPECREAQLKAMKELGIDWADINFFITHAHADHIGLVYDLASEDAIVYCSRVDAEIVKSYMKSAYWDASNTFFLQHGYPAAKLHRSGDDINEYVSGIDVDFTWVEEGDIIEVGGYTLKCIATPGHSPGHMCLYEGEKKFFISGDHILKGITSNITAWGGRFDCLGLYLQSLSKVDALDIELVLPAHRELIFDHHQRIAELIHHHENRLREILGILKKGKMSSYEVASHMHWDLTFDSWDEFPDYQKWFATGEAIAHLEHLVARGELERLQIQQKIMYELK